MKGSNYSVVISVMVGHKEYLLNPLCVRTDPDVQSDGNSNNKVMLNKLSIILGTAEVDVDPDLVLKVHSFLAESNPAVLGYAAQLGDEHVIREYLKNYPNEVLK